jgi:type VI secretion system secreted protein VgrG
MALQDEFKLTIESSDFSCDGLEVHKLSGSEAIGRLYDFQIEVVSSHHDGPNLDGIAGSRITVTMERHAGASKGWHGVRKIHGMVAEVEDMLATQVDLHVYRLRVVPRAFALTLVEIQDIYMNLSVPDIIKQKFQHVALGDEMEMRLFGNYPPRDFIVQYKESDLAFVSRLAEHLGVSFYFQHGDAADTMVFTDNSSGFQQVDGTQSILFGVHEADAAVYRLTSTRRMVPAYYAVRDYNYRTPTVDITGEHELSDTFVGGVVEYGTHHKTPDEAKTMAEIRAQERFSGQLVYTGKSGVPSLSAGMRVTIVDHPDKGSLDLLITEVEHEAQVVVSARSQSEEPGYTNTFRAIPADRTYRPPRVTPKPRIAGLVTGIVDPGPAGPEAKYAQIDEQGRYLVRFLFDTTPPGERPISRRVRMVQNHAGPNYGTHFPLHPGVEVVVGFVDGDPDRPVIVGAVPNPIKSSPVTHTEAGLHRIRTSTGIIMEMGE